MEFVDVVMKRRAVRRFEEGGVERDVIERIARLAQRTSSAGFSQGQRLIVVTEPTSGARSRACAARRNTRSSAWGRGSRNAQPSSSRASPRRSTTVATRKRTRSTTTAGRSTGQSPTGESTSGDDAERHAGGGERGSRLRLRWHGRARLAANPGVIGDPRRIRADRHHAGPATAPRRSIAVPEARLGAVRGVRSVGGLGLTRGRPCDRPRASTTRIGAIRSRALPPG